MSGLKNVLGNVYGDPDDRPNTPGLDDVQDSMDALLESTDGAEAPAPDDAVSDGAVSDGAVFDEAVSDDAVSDEAVSDEAVSDAGSSALDALDSWIEDFDDAPDFDDTTESVADDAVDHDDDPLAAFVEENFADTDASADTAVSADTDVAADTGFSGVESFEATDFGPDADFMPVESAGDMPIDDDDPWAAIDAFDADAPAGDATVAEASHPAEEISADDHLDFFETDVDDPSQADDQVSDGANGENWLASVDGSESGDDWMNDYDDETGFTGGDAMSLSADDDAETGDDSELDDAMADLHQAVSEADSVAVVDPNTAADEGEDAWLDDLFSLDDAAVGDAADDETAQVAATNGVESDEPVVHEPSGEASAVAASPASGSFDDNDTTHDLAAVTRAIHAPAPTAAPAFDPSQESDLHSGWARIDDDILPQKSSGRRRKRGTDDVAIEIDTQQLDRLDTSATVPMPEPAAAHTDPAITPTPALDELESSITASTEESPVDRTLDQQIFGDQTFDTAFGDEAGASMNLSVPLPEAPDLSAEMLTGQLSADDPVHLFSPDDDLEAAAEGRKGRRGRKSKEPKAARAPRSKKVKAPKEPRAKKVKEPKEAKAKRGRRAKKDDDDAGANDALLAQVDAAIASQLPATAVAAGDDFWGDTGSPVAPTVDPTPMGHDVADPLDVELVQPPSGFDPGPVLD